MRSALVMLAFVLTMFGWWFNTGCGDDGDDCARPPASSSCGKATDDAGVAP